MAVTAKTAGFTTFRGRVACTCLAQWLPEFEAAAQRLGLITGELDITQLTGDADASGGTHERGGAFDIWETIQKLVELAIEMGAAAWIRTRAQGFKPHTHGVLNGCPHNAPARYQVAAYLAGFNGLGKGGRGRRETAQPRTLRTWREGIAWARAQHGTTPTTEEDDMTPDQDAMLRRLDERMLKLMKPVEETHGLVRGVAKAIPTIQRWIGYLMPAAQRQEESLTVLRAQLAAAAATADPSVKADLERLAADLDAVIERA
ncbi:hypothetical protein [Nocardioides sp. ChNu-99]|uniref:hypothetical protein n=1 Tax=Nocardioides sp. ChNu-99 TaxID=2839897 RepID=UPI002406F2D4|nr:hypothetical protein [Nocardioides sp. ChNu-99]MDF9715851.1 hypothetical protein [Nocardioides sp. ChNu-99]